MVQIGNYLILFADLVGSTEVAVEVDPSFYAKTYVASFHWAARRAMEFIKSKKVFKHEQFKKTIQDTDIRIAGDEALSFTLLDYAKLTDIKREDIVASAIAFAYVTKLYWLASPYNLRRMIGKQFPRDLAVGIHIGPADVVPSLDTQKKEIASLHINMAKRIEGKARDGQESRIFASYEVHEHFTKRIARVKKKAKGIKERSPLSFTKFLDRKQLDVVKGIPKKVRLLELDWPPKDKDFEKLLKELIKTPGKTESETEEAASFLAGNFFCPNQSNLFNYEEPMRPAIDYDYSRLGLTVQDYIKNWFDAVEQLDKLFFDECWLVLNCYLLSCSLLRHPLVKKKDRDKYLLITKNSLFPRLKELMKKKKERASRKNGG